LQVQRLKKLVAALKRGQHVDDEEINGEGGGGGGGGGGMPQEEDEADPDEEDDSKYLDGPTFEREAREAQEEAAPDDD
jgi:hypothetical protein